MEKKVFFFILFQSFRILPQDISSNEDYFRWTCFIFRTFLGNLIHKVEKTVKVKPVIDFNK